MACQPFICDGINADGIEAKPLFAAFQRIAADLLRGNGIVPEIFRFAPIPAPTGMEKKKIRLIRKLTDRSKGFHADFLACTILHAGDDKCLADKLRRRHFIQLCSFAEKMKGRIHVGACMGKEGKQGFPKAIRFIGAGYRQMRRLRTRIDGHGRCNQLCQINHLHPAFLPSYCFFSSALIYKHRRYQGWCRS